MKKGYTLLEMLVVVSIISILGIFLCFNFSNSITFISAKREEDFVTNFVKYASLLAYQTHENFQLELDGKSKIIKINKKDMKDSSYKLYYQENLMKRFKFSLNVKSGKIGIGQNGKYFGNNRIEIKKNNGDILYKIKFYSNWSISKPYKIKIYNVVNKKDILVKSY